MENIKSYIVVVGIAGIVILILLLKYAEGFAQFGETLIYTAILTALFVAFDKYVMKLIDTIEELKKGNTAYAVFLLALATLFSAVAIIVK